MIKIVTLKKDQNGNAIETFDSLLKRHKKEMEKSGIILEYRKRQFYKSPSTKRREKHEAYLKKQMKYAKKDN